MEPHRPSSIFTSGGTCLSELGTGRSERANGRGLAAWPPYNPDRDVIMDFTLDGRAIAKIDTLPKPE